MNSLSNILLSNTGNKWLAKLDNDRSMFSIAVRDGVDGSLRVLMEQERGHHAVRERLFEEFLTTAVWGFGINCLKEYAYDPLVAKFTSVKLPDMDMGVIQRDAAKINAEKGVIMQFHKKFFQTLKNKNLSETLYSEILKLYEPGSKMLTKYSASNVAKFVLTTLSLTLLVALGVPTFNQWLTRMLHGQEQEKKKQNNAPYNDPADALLKVAKQMGGKPKPTSFSKPKSFAYFQPNAYGAYTRAGQVQFGSMTGLAHLGQELTLGVSSILHNERANTLIVDGLLSGGRTYKARNWVERDEIIFRELSIIFFLYYAQRPLQNQISTWVDNLAKVHSHLDFETLKYIKDRYQANPGAFKAEMGASMKVVESILAKPEFAKYKNALSDPAALKALLKASKVKQEQAVWELLESEMNTFIREQYLNQTTHGNLLLKTGERNGTIPVVMDTIEKTLTNGKKALVEAEEHFLKLHQAVDLKKFFSSAFYLNKLEQVVEADGKNLFSTLNRSTVTKLGAMLGANVVCAFFVAYLVPKIQHYITYKRTGKDYFPGLEA